MKYRRMIYYLADGKGRNAVQFSHGLGDEPPVPRARAERALAERLHVCRDMAGGLCMWLLLSTSLPAALLDGMSVTRPRPDLSSTPCNMPGRHGAKPSAWQTSRPNTHSIT